MGKLARDANSEVTQTGSLQGAVTQSAILGGASVEVTNAMKSTLIRVIATEPCFIRANVTGSSAVVTDLPILANIPEYFGVTEGQYIQAITAGGAGVLYITEV